MMIRSRPKTKKKIKGIKLDGTPKKITVPIRRGVAWNSMLDDHYDEIRLRRARRGTDRFLENIAADLGCGTSTLASFIRTHSDGTKPYTLRPRATTVSASVLVPHFGQSKSTPPLSHPSTPVAADDALAGIPFGNNDYV